MTLSRREFLRAGGAAVGALGAASLGWPLGLDRAAASPYLRKCVTLGANGVINPGSSQDYRNNRGFLIETGTQWVRLWADWPSLQPESTLAPDRGSGASRLLELDKQVAQANADGIEVILSSYRFPTWANGTAGLTPGQDATYQLPDRIAKGGDPAKRSDLRFKLPASLSANSAWGRWIEFLIARYSRASSSRKAVVTFLELANEPNLQMWPQQGPSLTDDPYGAGETIIQRSVATMFETAQKLASGYGNEPMLLGPASSDRIGDSRLGTGYDSFTAKLLDELDRIRFRATSKFAWSHHNFTDVEHDQGAGSITGQAANRAAVTRGMLVGRWTGWPAGDATAPQILIPEGGARLTTIASVYGSSDPAFMRSKQDELIRRSWNRMVSDAEGAGIAMFAQYLFNTDPYYDSGLCDADGTRRPAYSTWAGLPSFK